MSEKVIFAVMFGGKVVWSLEGHVGDDVRIRVLPLSYPGNFDIEASWIEHTGLDKGEEWSHPRRTFWWFLCRFSKHRPSNPDHITSGMSIPAPKSEGLRFKPIHCLRCGESLGMHLEGYQAIVRS